MPELNYLYGYIRSRQLEGSYNSDPTIGSWPISACRVRRGWGAPTFEQWPITEKVSKWPHKEEPPNIDIYAKKNRVFAYQRVRSIEECKIAIAYLNPVVIALEITSQWINPLNGIISMPKNDERIIGNHCVMLAGYDDKKGTFNFPNSWGEGWGDKGYGYLPYEYVERYIQEAWVLIYHKSSHKPEPKSGNYEIKWGIYPILNGPYLHGIEYRNTLSDDRKAWAFALDYDGYLNVEELFVMPKYRHKGLAGELFKNLHNLSDKLSLPLRVWISHADIGNENMQIIDHLAHENRLSLSYATVRWASYKMQDEGFQAFRNTSSKRSDNSFPSSRTLPM